MALNSGAVVQPKNVKRFRRQAPYTTGDDLKVTSDGYGRQSLSLTHTLFGRPFNNSKPLDDRYNKVSKSDIFDSIDETADPKWNTAVKHRPRSAKMTVVTSNIQTEATQKYFNRAESLTHTTSHGKPTADRRSPTASPTSDGDQASQVLDNYLELSEALSARQTLSQVLRSKVHLKNTQASSHGATNPSTLLHLLKLYEADSPFHDALSLSCSVLHHLSNSCDVFVRSNGEELQVGELLKFICKTLFKSVFIDFDNDTQQKLSTTNEMKGDMKDISNSLNNVLSFQIQNVLSIFSGLTSFRNVDHAKSSINETLQEVEEQKIQRRLEKMGDKVRWVLEGAIGKWTTLVKYTYFKLWRSTVQSSYQKLEWVTRRIERVSKQFRTLKYFKEIHLHTMYSKMMKNTLRTDQNDQELSKLQDKVLKYEQLTSKIHDELRAATTLKNRAEEEKHKAEEILDQWLHSTLAIDFSQPIRDSRGFIISHGVVYFDENSLSSNYYTIKMKRISNSKVKLTPSECMKNWINFVLEEALLLNKRKSQIRNDELLRQEKSVNNSELLLSSPSSKNQIFLKEDFVTWYRQVSCDPLERYLRNNDTNNFIPNKLIQIYRELRKKLRNQITVSSKVDKKNLWFTLCDNEVTDDSSILTNFEGDLASGEHYVALITSLFPVPSEVYFNDIKEPNKWETMTTRERMERVHKVLNLIGCGEGITLQDMLNNDPKVHLTITAKLFLYHVLYTFTIHDLTGASLPNLIGFNNEGITTADSADDLRPSSVESEFTGTEEGDFPPVWQLSKFITMSKGSCPGQQLLDWANGHLASARGKRKGEDTSTGTEEVVGRKEWLARERERELSSIRDWSPTEWQGLVKLLQLVKICTRNRLPRPIAFPTIYDSNAVIASLLISVLDMLECQRCITEQDLLSPKEDVYILYVTSLYNSLHRCKSKFIPDTVEVNPKEFVVPVPSNEEPIFGEEEGEEFTVSLEPEKDVGGETPAAMYLRTLQANCTPKNTTLSSLVSISPVILNKLMMLHPASLTLKQELLGLNRICFKYKTQLRDIYQYYASQGMSSTWVSVPEVMDFCTDCQIFMKNVFTKVEVQEVIDVIFQLQRQQFETAKRQGRETNRAKRKPQIKDGKKVEDEKDEGQVLNDLSPSQFIDFLVLLAYKRFGVMSEVGNPNSVVTAFKRLLNDHILKHAHTALFTSLTPLIYTPEVQELIHQNTKLLERLFLQYSAGTSRVVEDRKLGFKQYMLLLKECRILQLHQEKKQVLEANLPAQLVKIAIPMAMEATNSLSDAFLPVTICVVAFCHVQQMLPHFFGSNIIDLMMWGASKMKTLQQITETSSITFASFLEVLVLLALFRYPHPWLSVKTKFRMFLIPLLPNFKQATQILHHQ